MIEKMQFVTITGPETTIDHMINDYLSRYVIHFENALTQLKGANTLDPLVQQNPYKDCLMKANEFSNLLPSNAQPSAPMNVDEAADLVSLLDQKYQLIFDALKQLEEERSRLTAILDEIRPFRSLKQDLHQLASYTYILFRTGRIPKLYYDRFMMSIYRNPDTLFFNTGEDEEFVYGLYATPQSQAKKINAVYASMHFEDLSLTGDYQGSPRQAYKEVSQKLEELSREASAKKEELEELIASNSGQLLSAKETLETFSNNFNVRRFAACTRDMEGHEEYYILCGWMCSNDIAGLQEEIKSVDSTSIFVEDYEPSYMERGNSKLPPTKLKNPKLLQPFEMYIHMYGVPNYNEIDPTIFLSLTYALIFGAMFGDAGQGLVLTLGGILLYKIKKMNLAGIIALSGIFSTFFGFMYGSFFGFEDTLLTPIWLSPKTAMSDLPFVGKLNTVFVVTIAFGMFLTLLVMVFQIINSLRTKDLEGIFFSHNAIAGLVFYGALTATAFLFFSGRTLPALGILIIMFVIPLLLIFCKDPLARMLKKKKALDEGAGMFLVEGFFEIFEVLLSYFSNTLSFVRIGAYAVSHAAMMEVVLHLAGMENGGSPNWIVIVLGNIFVMGLEGLIVGIQVLRLEYYELFSRFYKGNGREFKAVIKKIHK